MIGIVAGGLSGKGMRGMSAFNSFMLLDVLLPTSSHLPKGHRVD
jgi:hypothetical protein